MELLQAPTLNDIQAAQSRIQGMMTRSPLVPLNSFIGADNIYLKLESLLPTGSFKLRGAGNALACAQRQDLKTGFWTPSAGNMALSLAWHARRVGIDCTAIVPMDAPRIKLQTIAQLGTRIIRVPFNEYQQIQISCQYPDIDGTLVHPFGDKHVMAGNGTIGLEILEELPDVEAILVPYGGGGLSVGIAAAVRAIDPHVKVIACEVDTATPLTVSLQANKPVEVNYTPSFVSGMGAPFVFPQMWNLASQLLDGSLVVPLSEVAEAIRLLAAFNHLISEGAGAVAVAAALNHSWSGKVVCIVSGGNIDQNKFIQILKGHVPE
jgi:threonine dehydratase